MKSGEPELKEIVEAALLAAGRPLSLDNLMQLFGDDERPERTRLRSVLKTLQHDYSQRSIELVEVASGYRFQVRQEFAPWVSKLWAERPARYSRALLETLALIAYRQPITRGEIEDVRGVSVSTNIIRTLLERSWVRIVGHRDVPGRPAMYATTREFLDYFNLTSLDELPTLAALRDIDSINVELELDMEDAQPTIADALVEPISDEVEQTRSADAAGGLEDESEMTESTAHETAEEQTQHIGGAQE